MDTFTFKTKVIECIALAERTFNITLPNVDILFDLKGRVAGMAGWKHEYTGCRFYLRFNVEHIGLGGKTLDHMINDVIPHEVAHTVCQMYPKFGKNHNKGWKRVCSALGGNGRRTFSESDAPEAIAKTYPIVYISLSGFPIRVSKLIHKRIQEGETYSFKKKGRLDKSCLWEISK